MWPKAKDLIFLTPGGIVTDVRLVCAKALMPIDRSPLPKITDVRLREYEKALSPMDVVASGMTTELRSVPLKASRPISRTPVPMVTDVSMEQS